MMLASRMWSGGWIKGFLQLHQHMNMIPVSYWRVNISKLCKVCKDSCIWRDVWYFKTFSILRVSKLLKRLNWFMKVIKCCTAKASEKWVWLSYTVTVRISNFRTTALSHVFYTLLHWNTVYLYGNIQLLCLISIELPDAKGKVQPTQL